MRVIIFSLIFTSVLFGDYSSRFKKRFESNGDSRVLSPKISLLYENGHLRVDVQSASAQIGADLAGFVHSAAVNRDQTAVWILLTGVKDESKISAISVSILTDGKIEKFLLSEEGIPNVIISDLYSVSKSGGYCIANIGFKKKTGKNSFSVSYDLRIIDLVNSKILDKNVDDWGEVMAK